MIIMKHFTYILALMLFTVAAKAQNGFTTPTIVAENVKATLINNNLQVAWVTSSAINANYWEVQASADGNTFSTIGLVLGADPKGAGENYMFKQSVSKIKSGFKYYRVLHVETEDRAISSNTIRLTK